MVAVMVGAISLSTGMAGAATATPIKGTDWTVTYTWSGQSSYQTTWDFTSGSRALDSACAPKACNLGYNLDARSFNLVYLPFKGYDCDAVYVGTTARGNTSASGTMSTDGQSDCITGGGTWSATPANGPDRSTNARNAARSAGVR
jgi:hypothetical protein